MPPKRKMTGGKRRKPAAKKAVHIHMHGAGWLGDAGNFVQKNQLISKGLGLIPLGPAQLASQLAKQVGLGRGRGRSAYNQRQVGRGIFSDIGGGIGSAFGGIGQGIGSVAHGIFG